MGCLNDSIRQEEKNVGSVLERWKADSVSHVGFLIWVVSLTSSLFEDSFGSVMIRNIMHSTCAWKPERLNFRDFSNDCQGGPLEGHLAVILDQVIAPLASRE